MPYLIYYSVAIDTPDDGVFLDIMYLGGEAKTEEEAEKLAIDITNDRSIIGTIFTKVFEVNDNNEFVTELAIKQFNKIAENMYEMEEIQERKRKKRAPAPNYEWEEYDPNA